MSRATISPVLRVVACSAASLAVSAKVAVQNVCDVGSIPLPSLNMNAITQDCSLARRLLFPYSIDLQSFANTFSVCFLIAAFLAFAPRKVLRRFLRLGTLDSPTCVATSSSTVSMEPSVCETTEVEETNSQKEEQAAPVAKDAKKRVATVHVVPALVEVEPVSATDLLAATTEKVVTPVTNSIKEAASPSIVEAVQPIIMQVQVESTVASATDSENAAPPPRLTFAQVAAKAKVVAPPPGLSKVPLPVAVAPAAPVAPAPALSEPVVADWHAQSRSVLRVRSGESRLVTKKSVAAHSIESSSTGTITYARGPDGTKGFALRRTRA